LCFVVVCLMNFLYIFWFLWYKLNIEIQKEVRSFFIMFIIVSLFIGILFGILLGFCFKLCKNHTSSNYFWLINCFLCLRIIWFFIKKYVFISSLFLIINYMCFIIIFYSCTIFPLDDFKFFKIGLFYFKYMWIK